jgi:ComF family protein
MGDRARLAQRAIERWFSAGLAQLFPGRCAGCRRPGSSWCETCRSAVERILPPVCLRCGSPLAAGQTCWLCHRRRMPCLVRSYAVYCPPLSLAILQLKYRPDRQLAAWMGACLAESYLQAGWSADVVVPIPLSQGRLRKRGYNQVELLARPLAEMIGQASDPEAVWRTRETRSQVGLNPEDRYANVKDAFRADPDRVGGRAVLLIDDLLTTGATLACAARAVRRAGGHAVYALTMARAA